MSSVNWTKIKEPSHASTVRHIRQLVRHCETEERIRGKHSNKDIDTSLTRERNINLLGDEWTAARSMQEYKNHIKWLDEQPGANRRKDRVTFFALECAVPADLPTDKENAWCREAFNIIAEQVGLENIVYAAQHGDEKHQYKDAQTGENKTSRTHIHVGFIPDIDGKLNGKEASSKKNIINLNNAIHIMSAEYFGVDFMDGSQKKGNKTVEQLKAESELKKAESLRKAAEQQHRQAELRLEKVEREEQALARREEAINQAKQEAERIRIDADNYAADTRRSAERMQAKVDELQRQAHLLEYNTKQLQAKHNGWILTDEYMKQFQQMQQLQAAHTESVMQSIKNHLMINKEEQEVER